MQLEDPLSTEDNSTHNGIVRKIMRRYHVMRHDTRDEIHRLSTFSSAVPPPISPIPVSKNRYIPRI